MARNECLEVVRNILNQYGLAFNEEKRPNQSVLVLWTSRQSGVKRMIFVHDSHEPRAIHNIKAKIHQFLRQDGEIIPRKIVAPKPVPVAPPPIVHQSVVAPPKAAITMTGNVRIGTPLKNTRIDVCIFIRMELMKALGMPEYCRLDGNPVDGFVITPVPGKISGALVYKMSYNSPYSCIIRTPIVKMTKAVREYVDVRATVDGNKLTIDSCPATWINRPEYVKPASFPKVVVPPKIVAPPPKSVETPPQPQSQPQEFVGQRQREDNLIALLDEYKKAAEAALTIKKKIESMIGRQIPLTKELKLIL